MTPEEYCAYLESVGLGVVILCPWCGDWEDIEDGVFDRAGGFWCCFGCAWPGSPRMGPVRYEEVAGDA